jgi:hypothetical protein
MLFGEISVTDCENHTEHKYNLFSKCGGVLNVNTDGEYS